MSIKKIVFAIFLGFGICLMFFSCKSLKTLKEQGVVIVEGYKTPIIGGAGTRGMKITLNLKTIDGVKLNSIEYNKLLNPLTITNTDKKNINIECYFYDKKDRTVVKTTNYKAEGDSCTLHYTYNNTERTLVCKKLIELKDPSMWE